MADAQTNDANAATVAHRMVENRREALERERTAAKFRKELMFRLGWVAAAVMPISVGLARLFFGGGERLMSGLVYTGIGVVAGACALYALSRTLLKLPPSPNDCESYGRHLVGLTFLLLVVGLANAVGTSALAFDGRLGFSAAAVIEASDPKHVEKADRALETAKGELKLADRNLAAKQRARARAQETMDRACETAPTERSSDMVSCETARAALATADEEFEMGAIAREDAHEALTAAVDRCEKVRSDSEEALFFLLSLSTMMALFGASFYVVNSVRSKRPARPESSNEDLEGAASPDAPIPSASDPRNAGLVPAATMNPTSTTNTDSKAKAQARSEDFDVHAFWSGACFRVGEAVLFTFAFFWLIWTSDRRTEIIWLPVLALFVGMFVKTGEAIIFRLGMRVLSAVESLLPAVPAATPSTPDANAKRASSTPGGSGPDSFGAPPVPAKAQ